MKNKRKIFCCAIFCLYYNISKILFETKINLFRNEFFFKIYIFHYFNIIIYLLIILLLIKSIQKNKYFLIYLISKFNYSKEKNSKL